MEDILQDIKDLKIKSRDIRFLFAILAIVFGLLVRRFVPESERSGYFIVVGIFFLIGLSFPKFFTPLYRVWMGVSMCIGFVVSTILFTIVFLVGFTPIGFLMKLSRQEPLNLSWKSRTTTYWEKKKKMVSAYEKQY